MSELTDRRRPTVGQVVLGLFVAAQLLFLAVANALNVLGASELGLFPDAGVLQRLKAPTDAWARWTYQFQGWTQYAPHVPHRSGFACVELRWGPDREPARILADIEPRDPDRFVKPLFRFRVAVLESWLTNPYWGFDPATADGHRDAWLTQLKANFRGQRRRYRDYMLWQAYRYHRDHPAEPPPGEIRFLVRLYGISPPGERPWRWHGPVEVPVTRWRFDGNWHTDDVPTELYDPFAGTFIALEAEVRR